MAKAQDKQKVLADRFAKKAEAYQAVFNTVEGKLVLLDLMEAHGMMSPIYHKDVNEMLHREGERNAVLRILKFLNINTKDLRERIEEHERDQDE